MSDVLSSLIEPFAPFLADPQTTEICVNRCGEFLVEAGTWTVHTDSSLTYDRLDAIGILAAYAGGQDFGQSQPLCGANLPGGERLQACRPPATPNGVISLTIRRPSEKEMRLDDPDFFGLFEHTNAGQSRGNRADDDLRRLHQAKDWRAFFRLAMHERKTIGVCGHVGSGKTTLLKRLLREIPSTERVVTIEDASEFGNAGPDNKVKLFWGKDRAGLMMEDCLAAALRMRPDRTIVQEIRGADSFGFLRSLVVFPGATSWHAEEGQEFDALELMVKQHPAGAMIPDAALRAYLRSYIDIIAFCARDGNSYTVPRVWMREA